MNKDKAEKVFNGWLESNPDKREMCGLRLTIWFETKELEKSSFAAKITIDTNSHGGSDAYHVNGMASSPWRVFQSALPTTDDLANMYAEARLAVLQDIRRTATGADKAALIDSLAKERAELETKAERHIKGAELAQALHAKFLEDLRRETGEAVP